MKKEGAIILGIGGDNSHGSAGTFYEGVMTSGYPSDATENAVQANIVAAGYRDGLEGICTGIRTVSFSAVNDRACSSSPSMASTGRSASGSVTHCPARLTA
jgi:hypothetical protein